MADFVLYAAFPYAAVVLAVAGGLYRYASDRFSFSSFSSQFLENRWLFRASAPWHYAMGAILLAHLLAALFPSAWSALIGTPARLFVLEITGIALGIVALFGTIVFLLRRVADPRLMIVTSVLDWVLLAILLLQVASGVYVAVAYRWGAAWSLHSAVPWFRSLLRASPDVRYVAALPAAVKFHILNAFALVALFPFTRLIHLVAVPLSALWRPYQLVSWNRTFKARPGETN